MQFRKPCPAAGAAAFLLLGCSVHVAPEEKLVFRYSEGIQSLHQPTYQVLYLDCHPDEPIQDLASRITAYESMRRQGTVTFSSDGIEVIKLGAIGRGAYYRVRESAESGGVLRFKTLVKPDYLSINFTEFPPNAVLYILGDPLGTVTRVKPGKTHGAERSILESVDLQWVWKKPPQGSREAWCLESVTPVPQSATYKKISFRETPEAADGLRR